MIPYVSLAYLPTKASVSHSIPTKNDAREAAPPHCTEDETEAHRGQGVHLSSCGF